MTPKTPYTYWTIELYDQKNGIRGGGGLGVLAADTRRIAEQMRVPMVLVTPFYPSERHQQLKNWKSFDESKKVNYKDFGFKFIDTVNIRCNDDLVRLDVVAKEFGSTRIVCITEPNFGELYSGDSCGDHRLYQEVALGFGGFKALKLIGITPDTMQLNEVATFFAALARLDELVANGMDFYEAVVYTRKRTLYTNHTLVQAAEASFSLDQFERFVFPNLRSRAVKKWLSDQFEDGRIRLSSVTIEIAGLKNGVSKLHANVANYRDLSGEKVEFRPITNGIDMPYWLLPETIKSLKDHKILDDSYLPTADFATRLDELEGREIRCLKDEGRRFLNRALMTRLDQDDSPVELRDDELVFVFKRRFVDYKRPWLPFTDPMRLRRVLEDANAHYIFSGRIHAGDERMTKKLDEIMDIINSDDYLSTHVHYLSDYDETLARALSVGSNISINVPIVGLEACGTSWEKDVGNLCLLISTHDGGVADAPASSYLSVEGKTEAEEAASLYARMSEAAEAWNNDFDLEYWERSQLKNYLPVISGTRMLKEYLEYLS